jgi:PAS domain S-box-containing protein
VEFVSNVYLVNQHPVIQCNIRDISERVRAEAELDRINNLLAEGQRIAHVGSWEYRAETQDTLWSEEQLRIYGLNPAGPSPDYQVLLRRCIHPEDAARLDETFRQCLQDRAVFALEHRLVRPDGIVRVVQELARPFSDDHGRLVKYVGVTLDITERKQAEEALAIRFRVAYIFSTLHEEEMFHEVLKLILDVLRSPFGVFGYLDEAGALVVPTMTRQIWDKCQVPDKTFIFPRATWGDSSWPRAVREKQANYSNAVSAKTPAGHVTLTRHICLPILFQGEVIGLFQVANKATDYTAADLGTLEAIAAQVAPLLSARLLRERAQKTLHREKEFARAVLDNIGDGVVACDAQGTLVLFNRTAREWHGMDALALPPGEWGRHFDLYGPDGTTPLPTDSIPLVRAFRGETVHDAGMAIVAQGQPPRYIQADGRPFYDAQQNLLGAVVAMHDISQRKQAESAIRQLNESLEKRVVERTAQLAIANQELEAFSYSVSHDLRAPLRALDGFSAALLEDCAGKLDAAAQEHLRRIRAGSQRMGVLIDDLLHLSRESRAAMRSEHVDLTALAHEIGAELQRTQPDRRMEWVVAPVLAAHGDARMLRVVLNNLLGNAWKYTGKRDGARIEVGVTVGPLPSAGGTPSAASGDAAYNGAVFFVRDNGAGFDMAYAGKLFGAFQRLHTLAEFPGSGIGLALVQRIIHRHGGRVWAEGAVGQGATFYFTLPGSAVEDNLGTHRP